MTCSTASFSNFRGTKNIMSNQEAVKLNRKLFGPAILAFAEQRIRLHGKDGYGEVLFTIFSQGGLDVGASPTAMRDWIIQQPGWRRRYDAALEYHEQAKAGLDPNHPELRRLERETKEHTRTITKLQQQVNAADEKQTAFEQLAATLESVVEPLEAVTPAVDFGAATKDAHPVDLVAQLTDQHADEVVTGPQSWGIERYNFDVFCLRLEKWATLIAEYATIHLPRHKVERLHIFHTGDATHGMMHDNKHRNFFGNAMRAAIAVADAQSEALAFLLQSVPYISMVGVSGNHPRMTIKKDHVDPHDNFDFMVVALMAARLSEYIKAGRLDIHAPKSWSAFVDVRGKIMALNHGDDVIGTWGIPWYGFAKKQARVQAMVGKKDAAVDFFWYGHHHTDVAITENNARAVHSGAFTATDAWTLEKLSSGGEPMQPLMVVDDRPGMRARLLDIPIWLRDPKVEAAFWAGKVKPTFGRTNTLTQIADSDVAAGGGAFPLIKARK